MKTIFNYSIKFFGKNSLILILAQLFISIISCTLLLAQVSPKKPEYSKAGFFEVPNTGRKVYNFNVGWRFYKGPEKNAESLDFDDSTWKIVSTPHGLELISEQASGSNNYQGEAWYRKHFTIPDSIENKRLIVHFEAIMGKCKVWLNGELIASHYGGYLPFDVDLSNKIKKGKENILAVWADNSDDPSYPPGKPQKQLDFAYFGGIYRDVWLIATNNIYVTDSNQAKKTAGGGTFIHYEDLSEQSVKVVIKTDIAIKNQSNENIIIQYLLKDNNGKTVAKAKNKAAISANSSKEINHTITLNKPNLWSPKNPYLYNLEILITKNNKIEDGIKQKLGIRKIEFKGKDGFYLNNKPYEGKLMGANRHQDFAYVGNALPNSGQWKDALILKNAGCEVIRAAHYPADPAFMDACDALGLFFIVATPGWQFWNNNNPQFEELVYQDIRNMVRRDRNRSSILLWEPILNETSYPSNFAQNVHKLVHEEYPYQGAFTACDARAKGNEYFDVIYDHPRFSNKIKTLNTNQNQDKVGHMQFDYGNENRSVFTREWGDNVDSWNAHNSTSRVARGWGEAPQLIQANHYASTTYQFTNFESLYSTPDQHVGGTLWHSFDHQRGYHPDPFYGGITDIFLQPKYSYYLFKSQVSPKYSQPMVYIANEMTPFSSPDITVFTNCDEVRLIVYGKDTITMKQNRKDFNMPSPVMVFKNVFNFMDIKKLYRGEKQSEAVIITEGIINGKVVVSTKKTPTNRKTQIKLEIVEKEIPLTADGSDFVTVIASVVDDNGNIKRLNNDYIKFEIEGEGNILGNSEIMANPKQIEWGTAPVLVQSTTVPGKITIKASILDEGINSPTTGVLTFTSSPADIPLIFNENPKYKSKLTNKGPFNNSDNEALKMKIMKLEKELNNFKLKEVEKQQQDFEGKKNN